jgi:hypothetical protein
MDIYFIAIVSIYIQGRLYLFWMLIVCALVTCLDKTGGIIVVKTSFLQAVFVERHMFEVHIILGKKLMVQVSSAWISHYIHY